MSIRGSIGRSGLLRLSPLSDQASQDAVAMAAFAEKRWVWVEDKREGYIAGYITRENGEEVDVQLNNDELRRVHINQTEKMNPPKFDKVEDMADLTYLNEASVVHNLRLRYLSNLIYTYSGLFLVAVNPYHRLPIYSDSVVASYKNRKRNEMPPHVFAISDAAYHDMLQDRENQSILITGESGAGKTENTKKVIQYLTSIASERSTAHAGNGLEQQILQANPILEAFGNAQSIRNNNSSRFGKFIRIEFNTAGQIAGANIERYLLEKSRVTHQTPKERNFHIFYQLLKTTDASIKDPLLLDGTVDDYAYVKNSRKIIDGVDDTEEFKNVLKSMEVMGFTREEQHDLFRVVAAILHLGNLSVTGNATDQAQMNDTSVAERVCHVLGIPVSEFVRGLLRPKIKAGRDWVTQARNVSQVNFSIEALARALYERMFGQLVERINIAMDRPTGKSTFIGVLDIAGFEIFETNSFEQLNINYTNEKLQQFFNHHMFVLEQEEYKREGIEWKFIDFGLDLQPTINLIEKANPIGILSCLDEECVMPQASDKTFTEKLHAIWKDKTGLYEPLRFKDGFVLKHYASKVEYNTVGWLDKNKDPLNDNITRLLAKSTERYVASLFTDYLEETIDWSTKNRAKKGVFRTVGQKYKEQLSSLMQQLYATQPHFVRCILPNEEKKPARINVPLVLDQLRCNGVLEGIRICRAGFPNRLVFAEFRQRYEILAPGVIQRGFMDGKRAAQKLLEAMQLDPSHYRIGTSKVFFRAGVLAELEEIRDIKLSSIIGNFQALCRGYLARRKHLRKKNQLLAIQTIQKNARVYVRLREWAWWRLYSKVKPLLNVTRTDEELKKREALIRDLEEKVKREGDERSQLELQRTKLETEKRQLEETLTAERNAALDQEEILKRKQETEVRLQESLRDVTAELEALEARLEEANAAKERLERELASLRQEHDDQIAQMERLERERTAKDQRIQQLMSEVQAEADLAARAINERKSVETRLTDLKQSLEESAAREANLIKMKQQLQIEVKQINDKLAQRESEHEVVELRNTSVQNDIKQAREALAELTTAKSNVEQSLARREAEITSLNSQLQNERSGREQVDKQRRELALRVEALQSELEIEKEERNKIVARKQRVEEEINELRTLLEARGDEESRQNELRRIREADMMELRAQLAASQEALEDTRRKHQQLIDELHTQMEETRRESEGLTRNKSMLDKRATELQRLVDESESSRLQLEREKRAIESSLETANDRINQLEAQLTETRQSKEHHEQQYIMLNARNDENESMLARLERERNSLQKQLESARNELEDEIRRRSSLETMKKKLAIEVADLQARLEEEESTRAEVYQRLAAKSVEYDNLNARFSSEVKDKSGDLAEAKRRLESEHGELLERYGELERQCEVLEKTRIRLTSEAEDLRHEIEREHSVARAAEKIVKQIESQLATINEQLSAERQARELADSGVRKMQSAMETLQGQLEEKEQHLMTVRRAKAELESELRGLINEMSDGGQNKLEVEKVKRRLENDIAELRARLVEEEAARRKSEELRHELEARIVEQQELFESDVLTKDSQLEETRRLLLKEVNSLGERLDAEIASKEELLLAKKKLEEQLEDVTSAADLSIRSKSDLEKAKQLTEATLRGLRERLEEEEVARRNFEELARRHERKSNTLQSELEQLEMQLDANERSRKQLEMRVADLQAELDDGQSRAALQQSNDRLNAELNRIREQLAREEEARAELEAARNTIEFNNVSAQDTSEHAAQLEKLEESKRALLVAQKLAQQELEDQRREAETLERQRSELLQETQRLKSELEVEIVAKGEEAAARQKLEAELAELRLHLDVEMVKSAEMTDSVKVYRDKIESIMTRMEEAELARSKAEKNEAYVLQQLKDTEESMRKALADRHVAEERARALEEKVMQLQDRIDDDAITLADVNVIRERLQQEVEEGIIKFQKELDEKDTNTETMRTMYQNELKTITEELERERSTLVNLREVQHDLEAEIDDLHNQLEAAELNATSVQKDRVKAETRLAELERTHDETVVQRDELQGQIGTLRSQLGDIRLQLEESEAKRELAEKAKKHLQQRLDEIGNNFNTIHMGREAVEKSLTERDHEAAHLREMLEQQQAAAAEATTRLKKSEAAAAATNAEMLKEREINKELLRAKVALENQTKELNLRIVELETGSITMRPQRIETRAESITFQLENEARIRNETLRSARKTDRMVRDLQFQLAESEKAKERGKEEIEKLEQRLLRTRTQLEELETSEGALQLAKRRAEREANEQKERASRLEREVERLKMRLDRVYGSP